MSPHKRCPQFDAVRVITGVARLSFTDIHAPRPSTANFGYLDYWKAYSILAKSLLAITLWFESSGYKSFLINKHVKDMTEDDVDRNILSRLNLASLYWATRSRSKQEILPTNLCPHANSNGLSLKALQSHPDFKTRHINEENVTHYTHQDKGTLAQPIQFLSEFCLRQHKIYKRKPLTYILWYVFTFSNPRSLLVSTLDRYSHIWYSFPRTSIETSEVNFTEPRPNCKPASRIYLEWWLRQVMVVSRSGTRLQSGREVGDRPWMKGMVVTPNGSRASCRKTLQPDDINNLSGFCVTHNLNAGQFVRRNRKVWAPFRIVVADTVQRPRHQKLGILIESYEIATSQRRGDAGCTRLG